ncbi:MAG: endonuclease III [Candidatus Woesebacteria bacterium]|jgi:endonuclease-3
MQKESSVGVLFALSAKRQLPMSMKPSFEKVFTTFRKHYKQIPLEIYAKNSYKSLIATLLSSRTKDEVTLEASKKLFKKAPDIISLNKLPVKETQKLIYPVGFYKTKAKYLKKLSEIVLTEYRGKIPADRKKLMALPGVGRKTANLVLNRAFDIPAIAVDTHVHRISNLLNWVNTDKPQETEKKLIQILPEKYWTEINRLFVSIGKQHTTKKQLREFLEKQEFI